MIMNGNLVGILGALKWPGAIVGGVGALAIIASAFGFNIEGPGAIMEEFKIEHSAEHVVINDTLTEIDTHMEAQQTLLEAVVRGECIENPKENLQRQGLIEKCKELGIER